MKKWINYDEKLQSTIEWDRVEAQGYWIQS